MNEPVDPITEINRRLAKLEQRVIDLIVPIQNIAKCLQSTTDIQHLIDALRGPIPINDSNLKFLLKSFESEMRSFDKNIDKMNEVISKHEVGEIKYIGNRLNEIEKILNKLLKDQPKKEIQIQFSCDGYDLVKKPIGYDREDPVVPPTSDAVKQLLDSLPTKRYGVALANRYGVLGLKELTLEKVGLIFKVGRERAREIVEKALRLCRHPCRKELVDNLPPGKLRTAIKGE